jgi:putative transposase
MQIFFCDEDYRLYRSLMKRFCQAAATRVLAYCLMPNHVHLVMVPATASGLHRPVGETHRRYSREINSRYGWQGHLWQQRFYSVPMDETHLYHAVRYVERNPADAGLCAAPEQWPWSSARPHLTGEFDPLLSAWTGLPAVEDYRRYLQTPCTVETKRKLEKHLGNGRPLGSEAFVLQLEKELGRRLRANKRGRKVAARAK